jgi:hypothetical protein
MCQNALQLYSNFIPPHSASFRQIPLSSYCSSYCSLLIVQYPLRLLLFYSIPCSILFRILIRLCIWPHSGSCLFHLLSSYCFLLDSVISDAPVYKSAILVAMTLTCNQIRFPTSFCLPIFIPFSLRVPPKLRNLLSDSEGATHVVEAAFLTSPTSLTCSDKTTPSLRLINSAPMSDFSSDHPVSFHILTVLQVHYSLSDNHYASS